jgi:general stress protein 26
MALSIAEREQFLAEPNIGALSISAGPDRGPLTLPIWYQYTPGGQLWFSTGVTSRKAELVRAAGRVSLLVERVEPSIRYVSVEGPVVGSEPSTDEFLREISERYLPADKVDGYLAVAKAEHGEGVIFHVRPERWYSADLGTV